MEDREKNIKSVLGDDTERSHANAIRYLTHLKTVLTLPITTTGREDFPWEEPYILGGWDKNEYTKLKKTKPSYTDLFDLVDIQAPASAGNDLVAKIVRKSDKKKFTIGLYWLTTDNEDNPAFRELDDYATWYVNY